MSRLRLSMACGPYDRMEAIWTGAVLVEGAEINYIAVQSPPEIFARTIRTGEFDVAEMSLGTFLRLRHRGDFPFVGLPVFPSRVFRHGNIFINRNSGIHSPQDLDGRRIGTFGFLQTASIWIRGILKDEFKVDLSTIRWVEGGRDTPWQGDSKNELQTLTNATFERAPANSTLSELLADGKIDALIGARRPASFGSSPDVTLLFPDYRTREREYFQRTQIFPIMHMIVIQEDVYENNRWLASSLFKAFVAAKEMALEQMRFSGAMRYMLPWLYDEIDEVDALFAGDPWLYGLEPNRRVLETFCRYLKEQALVDSPIELEKLFVSVVGEL